MATDEKDEDVFDVGGSEMEGSRALEQVRELCSELRDAEAEQKRLEDSMNTVKRHAHDLKTRRIPNAMAELNMSEFTFDDGFGVKISDYVSGTVNSLPDEEAKERAFHLIEQYGGASLIKTDLHLFFDKNEKEKADEVASHLREDGYLPSVDVKVNPNSLQAFVRERLRAGDPVDLEALGMSAGRVAKPVYKKKGVK